MNTAGRFDTYIKKLSLYIYEYEDLICRYDTYYRYIHLLIFVTDHISKDLEY